MYIPVFEVPQPERLMAPVDCKHGLHSIHEGLQTFFQEWNLICQCNIFNDLKVIPTLCIYLSEKKSLKITVKQNLIRNELLSLGIEIFQLKGTCTCKFFNCFSKILINKLFSFLAIKQHRTSKTYLSIVIKEPCLRVATCVVKYTRTELQVLQQSLHIVSV